MMWSRIRNPLKACVVRKGPYTLSVKLSDFTVWHHTWLKNWVNCAVLTGNSAGLRTVLSSRLSHRELRSSLRESHSFLSLPADTTMSHAKEDTQNWQKKNWQTWREICAVPEKIQFSFSCSFFKQLNCKFNLGCMGPLRFIPIRWTRKCKITYMSKNTLLSSVHCKQRRR